MSTPKSFLKLSFKKPENKVKSAPPPEIMIFLGITPAEAGVKVFLRTPFKLVHQSESAGESTRYNFIIKVSSKVPKVYFLRIASTSFWSIFKDAEILLAKVRMPKAAAPACSILFLSAQKIPVISPPISITKAGSEKFSVALSKRQSAWESE